MINANLHAGVVAVPMLPDGSAIWEMSHVGPLEANVYRSPRCSDDQLGLLLGYADGRSVPDADYCLSGNQGSVYFHGSDAVKTESLTSEFRLDKADVIANIAVHAGLLALDTNVPGHNLQLQAPEIFAVVIPDNPKGFRACTSYIMQSMAGLPSVKEYAELNKPAIEHHLMDAVNECGFGSNDINFDLSHKDLLFEPPTLFDSPDPAFRRVTIVDVLCTRQRHQRF